MYNKLFSFPLFLLMLFAACKRNVKNDANPATGGEINHKVLTEDLSFPWEILWGPDNMIWMTERGGRVSRINPSDGKLTPLFTISEVKSQGEGGLLGMVLHPDFSNHPRVFLAYNYEKGGDYREKIVSYTFNGTTLTSPQIVFDNISAAGIHNGCRLVS